MSLVAGSLVKNGVFFPPTPLTHVLSLVSHSYPLGQQCTPSAQHSASTRGQHPYTPGVLVLQQVFSLGHTLFPSGQITSVSCRRGIAVIEEVCLMQVLVEGSHW